MFLAHELVDLIVEVANLVVGQHWLLDARDLAGDLFEDLAAPFLARGDGLDFGDHLRSAGASGVNDTQVGCLGFAEAKEHGLGFLRVSSLWKKRCG